MSEPKKLAIEVATNIERYVDVFVEDEDDEAGDLTVTVKSLTVGEGKVREVLLCIDLDVVDGDDEVIEENSATFPVERWEEVKRMGDMAVAAYREKFPS